jgi:hypothetical protein
MELKLKNPAKAGLSLQNPGYFKPKDDLQQPEFRNYL